MRQPAVTHGPAALLRRTPAKGLLLTIGLHLLLFASWRIAHPPAPDTREERVFELISLPRPEKPAPLADAAPPVKAAARAPRGNATPLPTPEPEAITDPVESQRTVGDPFAQTPEPAPAETPAESVAGRARRNAIAIDRELRKGKPGVPDEPATPWGRFVRGLEGAHNDRSRNIVTETYTAPDGQVIYRFRRGGKYRCRGSGFVRPSIGGAEGGKAELFDKAGTEGSAGEVRCPSQVIWKRD